MKGKDAVLLRDAGRGRSRICASCCHSEDVPEALGRAVRCIEGPPSAIVAQGSMTFVFPLMQPDASCHRWRKRTATWRGRARDLLRVLSRTIRGNPS